MDSKPCGCGVEVLNGLVIRQDWCPEHAPRYKPIPIKSQDFMQGNYVLVIDPSNAYLAGEWEEYP